MGLFNSRADFVTYPFGSWEKFKIYKKGQKFALRFPHLVKEPVYEPSEESEPETSRTADMEEELGIF